MWTERPTPIVSVDCKNVAKGLLLTSRRIQSAAASVTLEVFGLLMGDENLQIIKVTLAVVTPRSSEDLLDVGILSLALAHVDDRSGMI